MKVNRQNLTLAYTCKSDIAHVMLIICITIATFWPVHTLRFLHGWDDQWAIFNYFTEDGLTFSNLYSILTSFYCGQYAPLNQLYYTFIYSVFGYNPIYYHIGGLIIHILNAYLIYYLLLKVANQISGTSSLKNSQIAFIATLLFAISPFNLEPVAWIAASKVTLYALFYFLAIHSYIKYVNTQYTVQYYLTIFLFILSFGAKEQAVTLPLCLLLIDYLYKRNLKNRLVIMEKVPFFLLSLLFGIISIQSQGREIFEISQFYPFHQRVILSFYTISEYFTKTLFPLNISYLYPFPFQIGETAPFWLWLYPAGISFLIFTYYKTLSKNIWFNFGFFFFIIHLVLVINVLSLARFSIVADRYAYVATVGIYFVLANMIVTNLPSYKNITVLLAIVYFAYFAVYTNQHIKIWTNAVTVKKKLKTEIRGRADFEQWKNKHLDK